MRAAVRQGLVASLLLAMPAAAGAQASAVHRQPLETAPVPGSGLRALMVRTIVDPGGLIASHTHPGLEIAYVAAGEVTVAIGDAPPRRVAAGGSFQVPPRVRHSVSDGSTLPAVVVSTYLVDPSEPLVTPAP